MSLSPFDRVDIIEFYPEIKEHQTPSEVMNLWRGEEGSNLAATIHVYFEKLGLDLKGIVVKKTKKHLLIFLPNKIGFDQNGNKFVRYPILSFSDKSKHAEFICLLRKRLQSYLRHTKQS